MQKKILVIGGTGMLGKPVAAALKSNGFHVLIFTRNPDEARIKMPGNFEFVKGDISNMESLDQALNGCYGVHINLQGGPSMKSFEQTEHQGTRNILEAAIRQGVERVTIISGASVSEKNCWFPVTRAKFRAEEAIKSSGLSFTIFRPSWFFESLPLFVRNDKAMMLGNNQNPYHWLAAKDYAAMVAVAYMSEEYLNKTLVVFGPEAYTNNEALSRYCEIKHPGIKKVRMSAGAIGFIGLLSFNPALRFLGRFTKYFEGISESEDNYGSEVNILRTKTNLQNWIASNQ